MTTAAIVGLVLKLSIVLTVFAVALAGRPGDATALLRRPRKLALSLIAMNVIMPLAVIAIVSLMPLQPVVKVTLVALSVSPVPPFLPGRVVKMGGSEPYIIGLLTAAAALCVLIAPVVISLLGALYEKETHVDVGRIALSVFTSVLAPVAVGLAIRNLNPRFADRIAHPIAVVAAVLLVTTGLAGLVALWPLAATLIGEGAIVAYLAFVLVGVMVGHVLGGPEPEERTVLAFATASRHPGIAIAITAANFPDPKLAAASVLLYLMVSMLGTIPYSLWRKHHDPHLPAPAA